MPLFYIAITLTLCAGYPEQSMGVLSVYICLVLLRWQ